jgi:hypothetical protein
MAAMAVVGISLGSYLSLVSSQNLSVMRSLAWASAVPAMEAGVEEALTHLYRHDLSGLAQDGWSRASDGWYQKFGNLGGGFVYLSRIQPVDPPVIVSTGISPTPRGPSAVGTSFWDMLDAARDNQNFVRRSVRVHTYREGSFFVKGMVAKGQIDISGNNVASDSFDSEDVRYSTGGRYDPLKTKDNGDIATNSGVIDSLDVGNAEIYGSVATGPGGSISIGPNGSVGDKLWVDSGNKGIQPGHSSSDMNVSFPDVEAPFTTGRLPTSRYVDKKFTWDYVLQDGDYVISSLSGNVLVEGNARLYIPSNIDMNAKDVIVITNNASLKMYVAAPVAKLDGQGVFNANGLATQFAYYGLPTNTELHFSGNSAFTGTIYAPNADFHLGGGGNNTYDFVGASITSTVKMNGHFNFHYDEALARSDEGGRGFIPVSWNEMPPNYGLPEAVFAYDHDD